ncbi:uncharacterized protein LOC100160377 isoform X2 [Acyrthosiphon pisum]|uniref:Peptidase S1 domain-containing protein n=1 Tax=Acyrthosiphon pisum TaxID=7029 RepID=A0A8R2D5Q1_ACYPI|nr:uncharacterized protein LOC100160377 isoform X2 [Acyrthosiphon pisum]|eukprot:XP_016661869.1 PREDICTED: uncharacterized protein LOC100160377 isoform X2 [Acyrthosiphon pisum]
MKVAYTWFIYSCLFFESGILCDRKLERRQAVSSCSVDTDDKFFCSSGPCIEWSWVCDGRKDCSDGSDETKELCARYEYGTNMTTSCGRVYVNNDELIDNDKKSIVGTLPWKVGIFQLNKDNSKYNLTCTGSIIAPNVVISAAQCFVQRGLSNQISIIDRPVIVVVGNYNRNIITMVDNDFTQIMEVVLGGSKNGTRTTSVLLESSLPFIDHSTCRKMNIDGFNQFVTFDKFCTHNKLGQRMLNENAGSGISFLHLKSYYITGILSISNNLKNDTVIGFTDIKYHVQWIRVVLNKHFIANSCVLPTVEGVVYSYEGSNEILSHGTLINHNQTIIENCEIGYHKVYYGFRICLGKGKWLSNFEKLCFKMCPPLESDSLDIKCSHNGQYANCSNLLIPDTIATLSCKSTYNAPNGQDETPLELLCQSNGMWNKQLYRCNPNCGRVYIIKNHVLTKNVENATVGTAPWNVGIYQLNKKKSNHDLICGGSIISPKLVVSAAHCFWQKGMLSRKISINDGLYKIAVGKYARNFTVIDNDFTQMINVETVHLNEGYYGPLGFHAEDIAIIVLQNRVSFSNGVAPVCIDWNGKYNVANGDQGKIVGWGETEKGIFSPILLEAYVPYINHSACQNMYTNGFQPYVTVDKFCAGSALVSGQVVGRGYIVAPAYAFYTPIHII